MALHIALTQWVFPAPFVYLNVETVPQSQIIVRVQKTPGVQNLLIECFMLALNRCIEMTSQRWYEAGMIATYVGARCQVVLRFGDVTVGTNFFLMANAAQDF